MKKQVLSVLYFLTSAVLLSSCASSGSADTPKNPQGSDSVPADTEAVSETTLFDTLPVHDYGGTAFRFLLPTQHSYEFSDEDSGDIVDAAAE